MVAGVPLEILTVPSTDRIGLALGGTALKPEESVNYSFGGVLRFGDFHVTLDAYQIELTDRIVLSGKPESASRSGLACCQWHRRHQRRSLLPELCGQHHNGRGPSGQLSFAH